VFKGDLMMALDPVRFSRSIGIEPDGWQADVLRTEGKRVILNCSRQSGKSTTTATKALHKAVYTPNSLVLIGSPGMRQSGELFRKVRHAYGQMAQRPTLLEENKTSLAFANGSRIVSLPGEAATVRGYSGVNLLLIDESAQVDDAFYHAVLPMLIASDGQLVLMSTPFGKRGFFHSEWATGGDEWQRTQITAAMCPRIKPEQLERQRQSMGDLFFSQEYECEFVETDAQAFSYDLIMRAFTDEFVPLL